MDNLNYTAENIEIGVKKFYEHAGQPINELNQWLMYAQCSPQAWDFPWSLLDTEKPLEVQFFGIGALHMKISRYWHELPQEKILDLREQLFNLIHKYINGPRIVTTRTCISIASFIIHACPEHWAEPIDNIIDLFNIQDNSLTQSILLETLTVLPEEFTSMFLQPSRRTIIRRELQNKATKVLQLLYIFLQPSSPQPLQQQAISCFSSWVLFGIHIQEAEPVAALIFGFVATGGQNFDLAVDSLIHLFQCPENHKYPKTIYKLLCYVTQLEPVFQKQVEELNMDGCQSLSKLIIRAAENNIQSLLNYLVGLEDERNLACTLINMILKTVAVPGFFPVDECSSDICFGFWYNFQDDLSNFANVSELVPAMKSVFSQLVEIFIHKVQYPSDDEYNTWNSDEKEAHRCYRQDIADAIAYLYYVLQDSIMISLTHRLDELIKLSANEQTVPWQKYEGILYLLTALMEGTNIEENNCLYSVFELLPRLNANHPLLIGQNMYFIASCAEFLSDNQDLFNQMVPFLLQGLRDPNLSVAASLALKDLLYENQTLPPLLVQQILQAIKNALDSCILHSSEFLRLICCVGYLLIGLSLEDFVNYSNLILSPYILQLKSLAATNNPNNQNRLLLQEKLKMMSNFFMSVTDNQDKENEQSTIQLKDNSTPPKPVFFLFENILPTLNTILIDFSYDPIIINEVCEVLKRSIITLSNDLIHILPYLTQMLISAFELQPHPSILMLSKQIMIVCSNENEIKPLIQNLFSTLCRQSLMTINSENFNNPDMVDALMTFLAQISKKRIHLLFDPGVDLSGLFRAGINGIARHEPSTSKVSCQFMVAFISLSTESEVIKEIITQQGMPLIEIILKGIGGEMPRNNVPPLVDILFVLNRDLSDFLCRCLNEFVNYDGFPNNRISRQEKEQFCRRLISEKKNKRAMKEFVHEYSLLWRGIINTEYAAQTS